MVRLEEIKQEIKTWQSELLNPECNFEAQTWIELQIQELKNERKSLKREEKWKRELPNLKKQFM